MEKTVHFVHKGTDPGPCTCISCGKDDITYRYIHLVQKQQSAAIFYSFVKVLPFIQRLSLYI